MFDILRRKKGMALKLSIDGVSNEEHFLWKNHAENMQQKLVPDFFIILVNNPKQPLHTRHSFKRYFE